MSGAKKVDYTAKKEIANLEKWRETRRDRVKHFMPTFLKVISKKEMLAHIVEHNAKIKKEYEHLLVKGYSKLNREQLIKLLQSQPYSKYGSGSHIDKLIWDWYDKHEKTLDAKYETETKKKSK